MKSGYREFLKLRDQDRADVFEAAGTRLDTRSSYVEKDFWVCLTLDVLFHDLPDGHPALSFKGGTSLSKVFNLIKRFSEDIDITASRADLGFAGDRDPANANMSGKRREGLLDELKVAVVTYSRDRLTPALAKIFGDLHADVQVSFAEDAAGQASTIIAYQGLMDEGSPQYVPPRVKIELGARAAGEPLTAGHVEPYILKELGSAWDMTVENIGTEKAERTFWEKAFILHGWQSRYTRNDTSVEREDNAARHYYDVAMLAQALGDGVLGDLALLDSVREHNKLMFRQGWKNYDEGRPGSFKLSPTGQLRDDIADDYERMRGMFLGDARPFEEIMEQIAKLQGTLNDKRDGGADG